MKIIHIVLGKANPERMNGVNKVVYALASEQVNAHWDVEVWGITQNTDVNYPERNFKTRLFKSQKNFFAIDKALLKALDTADSYTVFHLHGGFIPAFYTLSKSLKKRNLPFVFTPHGSYNVIALRKNGNVKRLYLPLFEKALLKRASFIHCLGKSEVNGTHLLNQKLRTFLIPYGYSLPQKQVGMKTPNEKFIVGFCGRLDAYTKGLDCLIKGFAAFNQQIPSSELWIIGGGEDEASLKQMASQFPYGNIQFLGSKYGDEKLQLIEQMDVFAHPSRNEGLPTAVLEAASLGVPCLVSEATNTADYISAYDCGAVIKEVDELALSEALMQLYKRKQQQSHEQTFANCMNMIVSAFSWKTLLNEYQKMYSKALYVA